MRVDQIAGSGACGMAISRFASGARQSAPADPPDAECRLLVTGGQRRSRRPANARRRPRAAQRRDLEAADRLARNAAASIPPAASGCFSSASSGDRRHLLRQQLRGQTQEDAGRRLVQRLAGGIVDVDVPALQLGRDAARQAAVGRDQRRALARRPPATSRNSSAMTPRLFLRAGAVDALTSPAPASGAPAARHRPSLRPASRQLLGRRRRPQRFVRRSRARLAASRPQALVTAIARHRPASAPGAAAAAHRPCCGWAGSSRIGRPGLVVERRGRGRAAPRGRRQVGDHFDQRGGRGNAAGRAGGDHGIGGRLRAPGLGLGGERAVAALGRIDAAFVGAGSSASPPSARRGSAG